MTRIYLIRHAEAEGNPKNLFHGYTNSNLTENGERQLVSLSERLFDVHYDAIYSSDLIRAYKTAKAINRRKLVIKCDKRLREINGGEFEGLPFDKLQELYPEEMDNWRHNPALFKAPGGESYVDFCNRITDTIESIAEKEKGKSVFIVTHNTVIKIFLHYINGDTIPDMQKVGWSENTAVSIVDFDDNGNKKLTLYASVDKIINNN